MKKTMLLLLLAALLLFPVLTLGTAELAPLEVTITLDKEVVIDSHDSQGETITATWTITGGRAPYTIQKAFWKCIVPNGTVALVASINENSSTIDGEELDNFISLGANIGHFSLTVTDADGRELSKDSSAFIMRIDVTLDKENVTVGEPVTAAWTIPDALAYYEMKASWSIYESDYEDEYSFEAVIENNSSVFMPKFGSNGIFDIAFIDAEGRSITSGDGFSITGSTDPLEFTVKLDKATVAVDEGETISGSWSTTGGNPPYMYTYHWAIEQPDIWKGVQGEFDTDVTSDSFQPRFGKLGQLYVEVKDSVGRLRLMIEEFAITGGPLSPVIISSMELLPTEIVLQPSETHQLSITIAPPDATYQDPIWSSNNPLAAIVSENGLVTAVAPGTATITAMAADGSKVSAQCVITVKEPEAKAEPGDANGDNSIDILDLVSIIDHIVSGSSLGSQANADANEDGKVDIMDLVWIIDRIVGG